MQQYIHIYIFEFITGLQYVRIGALRMLCMSRYVVHILGVQAIEVIRVQRLCCVSSILYKVYKI